MIHDASRCLRNVFGRLPGWASRTAWRWSGAALPWCLPMVLMASASLAQERVEPAASPPVIEADGGNRIGTGIEAEAAAQPEVAQPEVAAPEPEAAESEVAASATAPEAAPATAPATLAEAAAPDTAPRQAPSQPSTASASVVMDTLDLGTASITGMQELPRVLYIVPWKRAEPDDLAGRPVNSLLDEVLAPVDPTVFERHIRYYDALNGLSE